MSSVDSRGPFWYRRFRAVSYSSIVVALVWTSLIVLPFRPFSSLPPIIVGGGAGTWFSLAYILFLLVGVGGFGVLSSFLYTIEKDERRSFSSSVMWSSFVLLTVGFATSCALLAIAGASGGYASVIGDLSDTSVDRILLPYVYPITASVLIAVVGAALALYGMIRAGWPST